MPAPIRHACRAATGTMALLLAAARRRRARQDDRLRLASSVHVDLEQTDAGLELRFGQPEDHTMVHHGGAIQSTVSTVERLIGHAAFDADGQLDVADVSLTLVDGMNERMRLAAKVADSTTFAVGSAMMIALEFEGWVDHAEDGEAFTHSGAMCGRIVLTGGRDTHDWSLTFIGDYTAAPIRLSPRPTSPVDPIRRPTSAA